MGTGIDLTKGICYKIGTMDVPINGPSSVFFDDKSVVTSTSVPN